MRKARRTILRASRANPQNHACFRLRSHLQHQLRRPVAQVRSDEERRKLPATRLGACQSLLSFLCRSAAKHENERATFSKNQRLVKTHDVTGSCLPRYLQQKAQARSEPLHPLLGLEGIRTRLRGCIPARNTGVRRHQHAHPQHAAPSVPKWLKQRHALRL